VVGFPGRVWHKHNFVIAYRLSKLKEAAAVAKGLSESDLDKRLNFNGLGNKKGVIFYCNPYKAETA
jgi:hypothetical protein